MRTINLLDLFATITLDTSDYNQSLDDAVENAYSFGDRLKNGLATAAKMGAAAITAAAVGISALTQASIANYGEYEQLVGGVETLFKNSAAIVQEYADNAYETAGLSANEYMSTVTSFSASLLQGLNGDTAKAAEIADRAITDMADNANKMGTSIEMIQNAYQGFAKQNYTMLDNLKLGYGGTAAEMARLINDSGVLGDTIEVTANTVNEVSFDKIIEAIGVVQDQMGITGTTAAEASNTIQGSIASMQAAWTNLVTGLGDENANLDVLLERFVDSVATVGENLIPRITQVLDGIGTLIAGIAPVIVSALPAIIQDVLPNLIDASVSLVIAIVDELPTIIKALVDAAPTIIQKVAEGLIQAAPILLTSAAEIVFTLVEGVIDSLPEIIQVGKDLVRGVWDGIQSMGRWIRDNVRDFFGGIVDGVKDLLGIHSPSTVFAEMGKNMALGVGEGWEKSFGDIRAGIEGGMNFEGDYSITATGAAAGVAGGASFGTVNINISGANYSDERELAQAIGYELQRMTERRLAVFA